MDGKSRRSLSPSILEPAFYLQRFRRFGFLQSPPRSSPPPLRPPSPSDSINEPGGTEGLLFMTGIRDRESRSKSSCGEEAGGNNNFNTSSGPSVVTLDDSNGEQSDKVAQVGLVKRHAARQDEDDGNLPSTSSSASSSSSSSSLPSLHTLTRWSAKVASGSSNGGSPAAGDNNINTTTAAAATVTNVDYDSDSLEVYTTASECSSNWSSPPFSPLNPPANHPPTDDGANNNNAAENDSMMGVIIIERPPVSSDSGGEGSSGSGSSTRRPPPREEGRTQQAVLSVEERLEAMKTCREEEEDCCPLFKFTFGGRAAAKRHLLQAHQKRLCQVCLEGISSVGLAHHAHFIEAHAADSPDQKAHCPICYERFGYNGFSQHMSRVHYIPAEKKMRGNINGQTGEVDVDDGAEEEEEEEPPTRRTNLNSDIGSEDGCLPPTSSASTGSSPSSSSEPVPPHENEIGTGEEEVVTIPPPQSPQPAQGAIIRRNQKRTCRISPSKRQGKDGFLYF